MGVEFLPEVIQAGQPQSPRPCSSHGMVLMLFKVYFCMFLLFFFCSFFFFGIRSLQHIHGGRTFMLTEFEPLVPIIFYFYLFIYLLLFFFFSNYFPQSVGTPLPLPRLASPPPVVIQKNCENV